MLDWRFANLPRPPGSSDAARGSFDDPTLRCLHPVPAELLAYWREKCRDGRPPARADIDPLEMRRALPHVMLVDVVPDRGGLRFRFRLVGTEAACLYPEPVTNRFFDEVLPAAALERHTWIAARAVREMSPLRNVGRVQMPDRSWQLSEAVALPLVDGGAVNMLLVGSIAWPELDPPPEVRDAWEVQASRPSG